MQYNQWRSDAQTPNVPNPDPSWWSTLTKTFFSNLASWNNFWKPELGEGGCLNVAGKGMEQADILGPALSGSPNVVEDTTKAAAAGYAFKYAADRALTYPLRSGVVHSILGAGETGATYFAPVYLELQGTWGVLTEAQAAYKGTCR